MTHLMIWSPFLFGLACLFIARDRFRRRVLVMGALFHLALSLALWHGKSPVCGNLVGTDPLSILFLLITSVLFLAVSVSTGSYLEGHQVPGRADRRFSREALFTGLMLVFLGTMSLAIASRHPGLFWMAIEATTLASAPLICYQRSAGSLEAAWKYLLICSVGIAFALIGNTALAVSASFDEVLNSLPLTFDNLAAHASRLEPLWLKGAFAFLLVGYGTKMGLAPMHTWLPDAHSEAPSPVSTLLSGALLNCAFLGILRTGTILSDAGLGHFSQTLLTVFGLASMLLAGCFIVRQGDFKRLLAYSSIEHMGLLALAAGTGPLAWTGALLHAVNHSLTKGMLFLTAGNILGMFHTKSVRKIRGLLAISPFTGVLWVAGFLAICGVPPFGTFVSEFSILTGLGEARHWTALGLALLALALVFVGMSRIVISMAFGNPPGESAPYDNYPIFKEELAPPVLLGLSALLLGLYLPTSLTRLIGEAVAVMGGR